MTNASYLAVFYLPFAYDFSKSGSHFRECREVELGDTKLIFSNAWTWSLTSRDGTVIDKGILQMGTLDKIIQREHCPSRYKYKTHTRK